MQQLPDFLFHPSLLTRTPVLPYSDFKSSKLEVCLLDRNFQQAIHLASKDLYQELSKLDFTYSKLGKDLRLAVFKYYNRMSYRPTPFGAFASVALSSWVKQELGMVRSADVKLQHFADFRSINRTAFSGGEDTILYLNPSLFCLGKSYRYCARRRFEKAARDTFRIMDLNKSKLTKKVFRFVKNPVSYKALLDYLQNELGQSNAQAIIFGLVENQILFHSEMPTITGDHFPELAGPATDGANSYVIAYHHQQGGVYAGYQQDLQQGLWALSRLVDHQSPVALNGFIKKFLEKFGSREIPLLKALDPQMGISYLGTEKSALQNHAFNLQRDNFNTDHTPPLKTAAGKLMLQKLVAHRPEDKQGILFSKEEIDSLNGPEDPNLHFPPSLAITFRQAGRRLWIENAGGSSAIGMAGRFSHNAEILKELCGIAEAEQQQNPEVVFAEITAIDHSLTDNINTRGHLRHFELPVLVHSGLPRERLIGLNELTIQVINGSVVLRSLKLNKVIIPRMDTAYNYTLSNLPLLRLLGDLQYQGLKCNFSFDPEILLPGLDYYPRISFKNCILSPAKWIWNKTDYARFTRSAQGREIFLAYAAEKGLSRLFVLADQDRELVFDLEDKDSVDNFLQTIRSKDRIVLREYFLPEAAKAMKDESGRLYVAQQVAFLLNRKSVYRGYAQDSARVLKKKKAKFLPGTQWCYFKIYAHPETQNSILRDAKLEQLIANFCRIKGIRNWFFVRYADPHPHLRIRFQVAKNFMTALFAEFNRCLGDYLKGDLVNEFAVATYEPELERYGFFGMGRTERIFRRSSELVLAFHKLSFSVQQELGFAFGTSFAIIKVCLPEFRDRMALVERMAASVSNSDTLRIQLDRYYREHRESLEKAAAYPIQVSDHLLSSKMEKLLSTLAKSRSAWKTLAESERQILLADLIHMHVNRLNASGSAELERSTYYLLLKFYRSVACRQDSGRPRALLSCCSSTTN